MTKKKYEIFLDILTLILILLPIIFLLFVYFRSPIIGEPEWTNYVAFAADKMCLDNTFKGYFNTAIKLMGLNVNSQIAYLGTAICANAVWIYMVRILVEVMVFLPKLFIKWMRRF